MNTNKPNKGLMAMKEELFITKIKHRKKYFGIFESNYNGVMGTRQAYPLETIAKTVS